jgi:predicted ATP-dependent endonuclease of OLD family
MRSAALFVEGIADVKFLQDFVQYHFGHTLKEGQHIVKCSGNGGLAAQTNKFTEFALQGLTNCIIFDADSEE